MINFDDIRRNMFRDREIHFFSELSADLFIRLHQGCTDPGGKVALVTKFCVVASDIEYESCFVSALWGLEFFKYRPDFGNFCACRDHPAS
jgi:hypothetical protein